MQRFGAIFEVQTLKVSITETVSCLLIGTVSF